jgi:hypothetical protein
LNFCSTRTTRSDTINDWKRLKDRVTFRAEGADDTIARRSRIARRRLKIERDRRDRLGITGGDRHVQADRTRRTIVRRNRPS